MTSTIGGTGFGYASMSRFRYAARPATTRRRADERTMNCIRRANATSFWIMRGVPGAPGPTPGADGAHQTPTVAKCRGRGDSLAPSAAANELARDHEAV